MDNGWIKMHRAILDWEWYSDANCFRLFMHLMLKATHKNTRYRGHDLAPGDVIYGHSAYAKQLGITVQQIRTALDKLKSTGEITVKKTNKFSIISIANWQLYQADQQSKQQADNRQVTGNQQASNTIQEFKKVIREEGNNYFNPAKAGQKGKEKSNAKRGSRLPEDWRPNEQGIEVARAEGYSEQQIGRLWECFCDYWRGIPGQKGCKLDWDGTWRNYVRGEIARKQAGGSKPGSGGQRNQSTISIVGELVAEQSRKARQ